MSADSKPLMRTDERNRSCLFCAHLPKSAAKFLFLCDSVSPW